MSAEQKDEKDLKAAFEQATTAQELKTTHNALYLTKYIDQVLTIVRQKMTENYETTVINFAEHFPNLSQNLYSRLENAMKERGFTGTMGVWGIYLP